jgi:3-oxoacyl-[acyl-carrier protein] reductase
MDLGLTGRRALVLGSSSGLGRAVAATLAAEGAHVAVVSRDPERSAEAAAATGAVTGLVGDLTQPGAGARLVTDAVAALAGLDIVVVNTGGGKPGPIMATDGADDAAYHSMLRPVLEVSRAAAPHVTAGGSGNPGRLVYLTARSVVEATPELALSSVFRSGVAAAARALALELAPAATVNVVVTGQFDTPALRRFEAARAEHEGRRVADVRAEHVAATPMGRLGTAEEFADVVAFLCSARSAFVNGSSIRVDGGAVRGF